MSVISLSKSVSIRFEEIVADSSVSLDQFIFIFVLYLFGIFIATLAFIFEVNQCRTAIIFKYIKSHF